MRKYALWFFRQMSAVRGRLLLRIIAGLLQVALGLWLVWLCRRFIDVVIWRGNVLRETIVLFSVIALLIALRQLVFYLSGITEVILQNDMRSRLFRFVLGRKLYAVKHQAEAGSGKPASDMLSGDISQRLERDLSSASSVVTDILPTIVVTLVQLFGAFFLMRSIDSILAWSLLVLTPVVAVCAKYLGSRLKKMTLAIREEESSIQMMIQETVEHELTIKTLQAESTVSCRVGSMQQRLHHLVRRRIRFTLISRLLLAFTFSYGYFGAFVYGAFFLMRSIDSILAWSLLVLTPVVAVCAKYLGSRLKKMTLAIREEESSIQMMIQETVEHELTIKTLQAESTVSCRVGSMQQRLHHLVRRRIRFTLISRLLLAFTFSYGYFGAFVYGAIQLKNGLITFGVMTAFLQLVGQIQSPIMSLLGMIPQLIHASASVDRLVEIENTEQEESLVQADASIPLQRACGIRLQDVSYSYPDERKKVVVSHFSYDFRPATSVAIVGETGCGKTTILRLLSSIIQPDSGRIVLYDAQGKMVEGTGMRSHIVYIEQGNTLMSGTIRDNLLLANPVATDEQLTEALHVACADFVFSLPAGMDTKIGEHATRLSGGQAQRIAIARSLLREGNILLLDEISSSLDAETEKLLFDRLFASYADKTIICVTHRKEVADRCQEQIRL
jgi:ATP-binding cassette, subfamily B, bacterial